MPARSSGLLYALSGTLLTMFQNSPADLRQLPSDRIVTVYELTLRYEGSLLIDDEPLVQHLREVVSACAVAPEAPGEWPASFDADGTPSPSASRSARPP